MIQYLPYHQIDKIKYDYCISHSKESRVYAYSWYLDCTAKSWDLLIEGDYKTVMPLPRKVKYGIQYIFTPPWIQQLGVFSIEDVPQKKIIQFLKKIPNKYFWIDYQLNSGNKLDKLSLVSRKNYILSLYRPLSEIQKGFNINRKRILKRIGNNLFIDKEGSIDIFIEGYINQDKPYDIEPEYIENLRCLYNLKNGHIQVWNVFDKESIVAGLIWLKDRQRITYLVPMALERAKKLHASTFLINELIRDFQETDIILDFEGSMVKGVEKFYQSFGSSPEHYTYYKKRFFSHV